MLFDKIFSYSALFSQKGYASVTQLQKEIFGSTESTKTLREVAPETGHIIENIATFLNSSDYASKQQQHEAEANQDWMNMDAVGRAVKAASAKSRLKR